MVQGRTALATGVNKGLGHEKARQRAGRGVTVWIGSPDPDRGEAAAPRTCGRAAGERRN